jgi:hypothetical protein
MSISSSGLGKLPRFSTMQKTHPKPIIYIPNPCFHGSSNLQQTVNLKLAVHRVCGHRCRYVSNFHMSSHHHDNGISLKKNLVTGPDRCVNLDFEPSILSENQVQTGGYKNYYQKSTIMH